MSASYWWCISVALSRSLNHEEYTLYLLLSSSEKWLEFTKRRKTKAPFGQGIGSFGNMITVGSAIPMSLLVFAEIQKPNLPRVSAFIHSFSLNAVCCSDLISRFDFSTGRIGQVDRWKAGRLNSRKKPGQLRTVRYCIMFGCFGPTYHLLQTATLEFDEIHVRGCSCRWDILHFRWIMELLFPRQNTRDFLMQPLIQKVEALSYCRR